MEERIGIGIIVGLIISSSLYIWNNENFSKEQKAVLLVLFIFFPAQWLGILIVLAYNSYKVNNSAEKITERKVEQVKVNLDNSILSLKGLKEKGILTDEEYKTKVEKIEAEKEKQILKNSSEYKQLKSLLDSGVLSNEEFENKIKILKNSKKNTEFTQNEDKIVISPNNYEPSTFKTYFLAFLGLITFYIIIVLLTK